MAAKEKLVPITRVFLAKFYDKYPFDPIVAEVKELESRLETLCDELEAERKKQNGDEDLLSSMEFEVPHKMDENLWKNREQVEELLYLFEKNHWPSVVQEGENPLAKAIEGWVEELNSLFEAIKDYQSYTQSKVSQMVFTYMPQDFRGTLIKSSREYSERRRQVEVETLVSTGGTIAQKYALLWQQQMDRRKSLAAIGSATGVYKTIYKYLVGVPQVLLDFVKQINDHNGPMEEQRARYGPHVYALTGFAKRLRMFVTLWWAVYDTQPASGEEYTTLVDRSIKIYSSEFKRFLKLLRDIFENAPFLISAEDAVSEEDRDKVEQWKEVTVANGYKHEVPLMVEVEGSVVAWEFSLTSGKDVGFSVDFVDSNGTKTGIVPYQRLDKHEGSFDAPGVGSYSFAWDNSYSYLNRKVVKYKVDAIPPAVTKEQEEAEGALARAASGTAEEVAATT